MEERKDKDRRTNRALEVKVKEVKQQREGEERRQDEDKMED